MPPYRAQTGGMFGSGMQPRPGGNIDIASAVREVGNQASSLIQGAYLRKVAQQQKAQADAAAQALAAEKREAARIAAEERAANRAFRQEQLELQRERNRMAAIPRPTYDAARGVFITPPSGSAPGGAVAVPNLPPKPDTERSAAAGTFYPQVDPETGATTYFNPQTGATVQAPGNLQPRDAATATDITKQRRAVAGVKGALGTFKENIEQNGVALLPGITRAGQETDYENLQLQMKELYNLGVLNGPDLALMRRIVNEPGGFVTLAKAMGSPDRAAKMILTQIKKLEAEIVKREANLKPASSPRSQSPTAAPPKYALPFDPDDPE